MKITAFSHLTGQGKDAFWHLSAHGQGATETEARDMLRQCMESAASQIASTKNSEMQQELAHAIDMGCACEVYKSRYERALREIADLPYDGMTAAARAEKMVQIAADAILGL